MSCKFFLLLLLLSRHIGGKSSTAGRDYGISFPFRSIEISRRSIISADGDKRQREREEEGEGERGYVPAENAPNRRNCVVYGRGCGGKGGGNVSILEPAFPRRARIVGTLLILVRRLIEVDVEMLDAGNLFLYLQILSSCKSCVRVMY